MTISEDEIADLIEFWIKTDDNLFIEYGGTVAEQAKRTTAEASNKATAKVTPTSLPNSNDANEFIGSE